MLSVPSIDTHHQSKVVTEKVKFLRETAGVIRKDRIRNEVSKIRNKRELSLHIYIKTI